MQMAKTPPVLELPALSELLVLLKKDAASLDYDTVRAQVLAFNGSLEPMLVSAGKQLLNSGSKAQPAALQAVFLFTKQYVQHLERIDRILEKDKPDLLALEPEMTGQCKDIAPLLSLAGGLKAPKDVKACLRLLKQKTGILPKFSNPLAPLVKALDDALPPLEKGTPVTDKVFLLYYALFAVCVAIGWGLLLYALALTYVVYSGTPEVPVSELMLLSAAIIAIAIGIGRFVQVKGRRKRPA